MKLAIALSEQQIRYRTIFSFQASLCLQRMANPYMTPTYLSIFAAKDRDIKLKKAMFENLPDSEHYRRVIRYSPLRWPPNDIVVSGQSTELQVILILINRRIHTSLLDGIDIGVTKRRCCTNKIAKPPTKIRVRFEDRQCGYCSEPWEFKTIRGSSIDGIYDVTCDPTHHSNDTCRPQHSQGERSSLAHWMAKIFIFQNGATVEHIKKESLLYGEV